MHIQTAYKISIGNRITFLFYDRHYHFNKMTPKTNFTPGQQVWLISKLYEYYLSMDVNRTNWQPNKQLSKSIIHCKFLLAVHKQCCRRRLSNIHAKVTVHSSNINLQNAEISKTRYNMHIQSPGTHVTINA